MPHAIVRTSGLSQDSSAMRNKLSSDLISKPKSNRIFSSLDFSDLHL